jgi:hypothetical protein
MCIKEKEAAAGGDVGSFDFEHFKRHFITGTRGGAPSFNIHKNMAHKPHTFSERRFSSV